jgi:FeS assembly SUF system protein
VDEAPQEQPENKTVEALSPLGERVIAQLKTVYDPEIPVNVFDLGLIYNIDIKTLEGGLFDATIDMTLTTPNCPIADQIPPLVQSAVKGAEGANDVVVNLVWDPPWDRSRMSDEARMQLDMF